MDPLVYQVWGPPPLGSWGGFGAPKMDEGTFSILGRRPRLAEFCAEHEPRLTVSISRLTS